MNLIPEVIVHSQSQDEEQVRDHYDRESKGGLSTYRGWQHREKKLMEITFYTSGGDDFYEMFLGPRM